MKWSDYDMKDLPILWLIFNTKIGRVTTFSSFTRHNRCKHRFRWVGGLKCEYSQRGNKKKGCTRE